MSIAAAVIALSFLVFFHELGHFIAAKLLGVGVLEFSIGMGPRLISRVYRNTRYSLKLLPLGGSCAMLGEDDAGSGDFTAARGQDLTDGSAEWRDFDGVKFRNSDVEKYSFQNKAAWKRFIICIAGVLNNFILALVLSAVVIAATGFDLPYVVSTQEGTPAAEAGFKEGDRLTGISMDGKNGKKIDSFRDLYLWLYIYSGDFKDDTDIRMTYIRDGARQSVSIHPYYAADAGKYKLGISFFNGRIAADSPKQFLLDTWYEVRYNISIVFDSFKMLAAGKVHRNEVMGPVGAVSVMGSTVQESSKYGVANAAIVLAELCVMLSSNLGVMNLLPIPALDGGRLLFILLEMISRRRLNPRLEEKINEVGMILLLIFMALIMGNDIMNLFTGAYKSIGG